MDMDEVLKEAMSGDRMMDPAMMAVRVLLVSAAAVAVCVFSFWHVCLGRGDNTVMHFGMIHIIRSFCTYSPFVYLQQGQTA
jgi:hypothetical protein